MLDGRAGGFQPPQLVWAGEFDGLDVRDGRGQVPVLTGVVGHRGRADKVQDGDGDAWEELAEIEADVSKAEGVVGRTR